MKRNSEEQTRVIRDLGDGLILRRARAEDTDALARFNCDVHCANGSGLPRQRMKSWIRDLMSGDHPTFRPSDFTVVEEVTTGAIVSSLCLISQTWSYGGIRLPVGLPELVGTKPEYRRRGLVRAQFDVVHEWSARRKQLMQAIGGIPNFYRQFGYEMALATGEDGGSGPKSEAPQLKRGQKEPFRVRPAVEADLPFIARLYRESMSRYLVTTVRSRAVWQWELAGRRRTAMERRELRIIESPGGERVGFVVHKANPWLSGNSFGAEVYELKPGVSWLAVTPTVVRYLVSTGEKYAARCKKRLDSFGFGLRSGHPVYTVIPSLLPRGGGEPYALYVRVPDLPDFLRHIAPVLERRLAESPAVGHTGELRLSFYRDGVRLVLRRGRLATVEAWDPARGRPSAAFPGLTFLHVLFGHRTMEDLRSVYADCYADGDEAGLLLRTLFPKMPSEVWCVV